MADRRRVLLVDDDASGRTALSWLLEDAGFEVAHADSLRSARAALAAIAADPVLAAALALVVVDLHLGDGVGTSLVPEVRALSPSTKVAILTGATQSLASLDGDLVLTKAREPAEVLEALCKLARA